MPDRFFQSLRESVFGKANPGGQRHLWGAHGSNRTGSKVRLGVPMAHGAALTSVLAVAFGVLVPQLEGPTAGHLQHYVSDTQAFHAAAAHIPTVDDEFDALTGRRALAKMQGARPPEGLIDLASRVIFRRQSMAATEVDIEAWASRLADQAVRREG